VVAETSLANQASELETTWQQEGHPSLAQAQCALACAEKSTLPSVRVLAYAKLKGRAEPASTLASNSLPKRPTGGSSTRGGIGFVGGASFLIVAHAAVRAHVLVSNVLGDHFPIHYTTPLCDNSPPKIGAGMSSTFFAEQLTDNLHQQVAAMIAEANTKHGLQNSNLLGLSTRATDLANTNTSSQVKLSPCIRVNASLNCN
jgi:hypothetical protein